MFEHPRKLNRIDDVRNFDCGKLSLNDWLKKFAWRNQQAETAVTYVVVSEGQVLAYYSLSMGAVAPSDAEARIAKGIGRYPVPVLLLARLAVDKSVHRRGLGYSLMQDVFVRTISVAEQVGVRALLVDVLDAEARSFYEQWGFVSSPVHPMKLMLLTKSIRRSIEG